MKIEPEDVHRELKYLYRENDILLQYEKELETLRGRFEHQLKDNWSKLGPTLCDGGRMLDHVRDMILQVLFTNPGERVNRPDFGCGLLQMVFMPNSDALATATQFLVQGALQRWLVDEIQVENVQVTKAEERLVVEVTYVRRDNGQREQAQFFSPAGGL